MYYIYIRNKTITLNLNIMTNSININNLEKVQKTVLIVATVLLTVLFISMVSLYGFKAFL